MSDDPSQTSARPLARHKRCAWGYSRYGQGRNSTFPRLPRDSIASCAFAASSSENTSCTAEGMADARLAAIPLPVQPALRPRGRALVRRWPRRYEDVASRGAVGLLQRCAKAARAANDALAPLTAAEREHFIVLLIRISGTDG
jgi:hypothetical protein